MAGILSYALTLNTSGFSRGISAASGLLRGLSGAAAGAAGALAKVAAPLTALGGGVGVFAALNKAANFEQLSTSMEVLTGSATEAKKLLDALKADSNKTPFEFGDYAEAGKILIALGGNTEDVRGELKALGDIASGLNIPLNEMATAYGKARNDGVLYMETLNQFNDKGIPVMSMLAQKIGVSTTEVKKLASEGQIGFGQLQEVLSELTAEGGKFFGMMDKQAGTTKGLLSSLKSALDNLLVTIGTPVNDFLKPMLDGNLVKLQLLNEKVVAFFKLMSAARDQGKLGDFIGASLKLGVIEAVNTLSGGIRSAVAYLASALPVVFSEAADMLTSPRMVNFFDTLFTGLGQKLLAVLYEGAAGIAEAAGFNDMARNMAIKSGVNSGLGAANIKGAGNAFSGADFGAAMTRIGKALTDAHTAGTAAAREAAARPLIDPQLARDEWKNLAKALDPKALEDILKNEVSGAAGKIKELKDSIAKLAPAVAAAPAKKEAAVAAAGVAIPPAAGDAEPQGRPAFRNAEQSARARMENLLAKQTERAKQFTQADRLQLAALQRKFDPAAAAAQLARGAAAADPARARRAAAAPNQPDPILKLVQGIHDKLAKLATA